MSERWFRLYEGVVNDPKLQRLPAETFRGLINLWCVASANGGKLPPMGELGFLLRMSDKDACQLIVDLDEAGLLDTHEDYTCPHNWNVRQYKSDVSTERVKRHRERKATVSGNVPPPLHETPPDTETEQKQNRAESRREFVDQVEKEIREAAGLENAPSPSLFDLSPILTLLDSGYDLSKDILPKLREAKAKGQFGSSWRYYVPGITQAKEKNGSIQPKPTSQPAKTQTVWLTEDDPRFVPAARHYERDTGKTPTPRGSRFNPGQGFPFPSDYPELSPPTGA